MTILDEIVSEFMMPILQVLEQGLDGVVLKVEDMDDIIKLKVFHHNSVQTSLVFNK